MIVVYIYPIQIHNKMRVRSTHRDEGRMLW
jgi:hypothetical protein